MKKSKLRLKTIFSALILLLFLGLVTVLGIDFYVKKSTENNIITSGEAAAGFDADCILVLGCQVNPDGSPSDMLADRLKRGVELYNLGAAPKLLMSGDHGREEYNEVETMKRYAVDAGISSSDVFMDHAGFSTYESIYRAKKIFEADKIIIVTQKYHLYRALYVADKLGVEAYGVASDYHTYLGQSKREVREVLARNKDFVISVVKPEPTYLGEVIPVSGNGDITNDRKG